MTFSIRTFLVVIAILSVWLGALVSKSPLLVELAASGTVLLILLSLALAIWEPRPLLRAFWTGFFALAFGNLLYNGFFSSYQQTSSQVAQAIMGTAPGYGPGAYTVPAYSTPTRIPATFAPPSANLPVTSFFAPDDASADSPPALDASPYEGTDEKPESETPNNVTPAPAPMAYPTTGPVPQPMPPVAYPVQMPYTTAYNGNYYEQRQAIVASVPSLISLLVGVIGGCVTMWIASRPKAA